MKRVVHAQYCKPKIENKKIKFLVMFGYPFSDDTGTFELAQTCDCGAPCFGSVIGTPCFCTDSPGNCSS